MTSEECVLCRRGGALDAMDPGWLLRTGYWGVSMHPAMPVPGWIAAQTLRHTEGLVTLEPAEADELGPLLTRLSAAVTTVTGAPRVYSYSLGEGCPHTHILIGPPQGEQRGTAFQTALLRREESLADEAAAVEVAHALADALNSSPTNGKR